MNLRPFEEFTDHSQYSRLNIYCFIHVLNFGDVILPPPPGVNRVKKYIDFLNLIVIHCGVVKIDITKQIQL